MASPVTLHTAKLDVDEINCRVLNGARTDSFTYRYSVPAIAGLGFVTLATLAHPFTAVERIELCGVPDLATSGTLTVNVGVGTFNTLVGPHSAGQTSCSVTRHDTAFNVPNIASPMGVTLSVGPGDDWTDVEVTVILSK